MRGCHVPALPNLDLSTDAMLSTPKFALQCYDGGLLIETCRIIIEQLNTNNNSEEKSSVESDLFRINNAKCDAQACKTSLM